MGPYAAQYVPYVVAYSCIVPIDDTGLEARTEVNEEMAAQVSSMPSVQITKSSSAKSSALPVSYLVLCNKRFFYSLCGGVCFGPWNNVLYFSL